MAKVLGTPRKELSKYAPRLETIKINPEKIGALIGPGGKNIKKLVEESGCEINIEDDGTVNIYSVSEEGMKIARDAISAADLNLMLLDATSGNTGIAYAMLGAALRFPVTLCMPSNVSQERKRYLNAYGAKVVWTNPADGSDGAIRKARRWLNAISRWAAVARARAPKAPLKATRANRLHATNTAASLGLGENSVGIAAGIAVRAVREGIAAVGAVGIAAGTEAENPRVWDNPRAQSFSIGLTNK